jgi:3-oxoacid CoA-transferase
VFNVDKEEGLTLTEIADGVGVEDIIAATECEFAVSSDLKPMIQVSDED